MIFGASTYACLCDLVAPDEPGKPMLDQISSVLKQHYEPTRVQIAERFSFCKMNQAAGESITDYDVAFCKLAMYCDFGANLEVELRDQIVCSLRNESLQRRLLTVDGLTYKKTMELEEKNA